MKKSMLRFVVCVTVAVAVFLTGCPNPAGGGGGRSGGGGGSKGGDSAYIASAELSGFLRSVLGGYTTNSAPSGDTPDTFVIDATDFSSKKDFGIMLKVGLAGKNVIIDAPTKDELKGLAAAIKSYLSGNEDLSAEYDAADFNSLEFLAAQFEGLSGSEKAYEAVGLRGSEIYFVHRFDKDPYVMQEHVEPDDSSLNIRSAGASENISAASRAAGDNDIEALAAQYFAEWISEVNDKDSNARYMSSKDVAGFRAAGNVPDVEKLVKAQTIIRSFKARSSGVYAGREEIVEVRVDVWPACKMDTQEDFYMVHQQVVANNDQLGADPWMNRLTSCMYFKDYEKVKDVRDLSPQNAIGSTSFTTGSSFSITGQFGISGSGPSGSVSSGLSFSKSSSTSIPDITVIQGLWKAEDGRYIKPFWGFDGPYWDHGKKYTPKNIQKRRAVFDTYAVFVLKSATETDNSPVQLDSMVDVEIAYNGYRPSASSGVTVSGDNLIGVDRTSYHDCHKIIRPSNVRKNFIMSFTPPTGKYSLQDRAVLRDAVKKFNQFWGENVPYYAVGGEKQLNETAKNYFKNAMNIVKKNKNVLQDAGFEGKFKFYIQDPEKGTQLATEDVDF